MEMNFWLPSDAEKLLTGMRKQHISQPTLNGISQAIEKLLKTLSQPNGRMKESFLKRKQILKYTNLIFCSFALCKREDDMKKA